MNQQERNEAEYLKAARDCSLYGRGYLKHNADGSVTCIHPWDMVIVREPEPKGWTRRRKWWFAALCLFMATAAVRHTHVMGWF